MTKKEEMIVRAANAICASAILGGCATQREQSLYKWGHYQSVIYKTSVEPGAMDPNTAIAELAEDIKKGTVPVELVAGANGTSIMAGQFGTGVESFFTAPGMKASWLPEDGFLSNLLTGKKWAKVEQIVAESRKPGHFKALIQSQVRSRLAWMGAVNELTAKAAHEVIEAQEKLAALKQLQASRLNTLANAVVDAEMAHDAARRAYDLYVGESYVVAGRER